MTKAYSLDLRRRVVRFVDRGHSRREAAALYDVSVAFVVKLVAAWRATGSYVPKPEGGWRYSKLDPHRAYLERRMAEKPDITMPELALELAGKGVQVAPASVSRWYLRNGYRYKKNTAGIGTRTLGRARRAA
jgi:transposase